MFTNHFPIAVRSICYLFVTLPLNTVNNHRLIGDGGTISQSMWTLKVVVKIVCVMILSILTAAHCCLLLNIYSIISTLILIIVSIVNIRRHCWYSRTVREISQFCCVAVCHKVLARVS